MAKWLYWAYVPELLRGSQLCLRDRDTPGGATPSQDHAVTVTVLITATFSSSYLPCKITDNGLEIAMSLEV